MKPFSALSNLFARSKSGEKRFVGESRPGYLAGSSILSSGQVNLDLPGECMRARPLRQYKHFSHGARNFHSSKFRCTASTFWISNGHANFQNNYCGILRFLRAETPLRYASAATNSKAGKSLLG
jgi:hypothetical protein